MILSVSFYFPKKMLEISVDSNSIGQRCLFPAVPTLSKAHPVLSLAIPFRTPLRYFPLHPNSLIFPSDNICEERDQILITDQSETKVLGLIYLTIRQGSELLSGLHPCSLQARPTDHLVGIFLGEIKTAGVSIFQLVCTGWNGRF